MFDTEKDLQCHLAKLPARCQDDAEILWKDVGVRSSAELTNLDPNDLIGFGYDRFAARYLPLEARIAGDRALPAGDADMAQTVGMPRMCVREIVYPVMCALQMCSRNGAGGSFFFCSRLPHAGSC